MLPGWSRDNPGYSCKHIRDSGPTKEDGEYWIDPERNRNPLKVYCDMTTDGGKAGQKTHYYMAVSQKRTTKFKNLIGLN